MYHGGTAHFGYWGETPRCYQRGASPKSRREPLPGLNYAQVSKRRLRGWIVEVPPRVVFGFTSTVEPTLNRAGHHIDTALGEWLNLMLQLYIPTLVRKVLSFVQTTHGLTQLVNLTGTAYNFYHPHRAPRLALPEPIPPKGYGALKQWQTRTIAMVAGITGHVWTVTEFFSDPLW